MEEFIKEKKKVHKILKAKKFAEKAHGDQMYGSYPYIKHLELVSQLAEPFGENAQVLSYLHDVVEDTETTVEEIKNEFGIYIAECIELITDCPGKNRKERKLKTNEKLTLSQNKDVLIVKTADRLINMAICIANKEKGLFTMYKNEYNEFKKAVYREGLCDKLWNLLDHAVECQV